MGAILGAQPDHWDESDWLDWRRDGIGGSDVAALCGLSRFASPTSIYVDKLQLGAPREPNEAMLWGHLLEEPIAREVESRTGLFVVHAQALAADADAMWRRCTLDGLVAERADLGLTEFAHALGTCQIKTSSDFGWDTVPDEYVVQVQWEMGITGLPHVWLAVLHQGRRLVIYEIDADPRIFTALCSIADRFWHDNVARQSPPLTDGSDATTEALKAAFGAGDQPAIALDESVVAVAKEWPQAKARVKEAERDVERIENALRAALEDAVAGGLDRNGELVELVTWKPQSSGARLDTKRLKAERPDIAREYTPPAGTTRVLRSTKALLALVGAEEDQGET